MAVKKKPATKPPADTEEEKDPTGTDDDEDEAVTRKDVQEMVNAAVTGGLKGFAKKKLPALLKNSLATALAEAGLGNKKPAGGDEEEDDEEEEEEETEAAATLEPEKKGKAKKGEAQAPASTGKPSKAEKEVAKLKRQMDEMTKAQADAAAKAQATELRGKVTEALVAAGVRKEMVAPLATFLLSDESGKRVRRDEEGAIVFAAQDSDGDEDLVKLGDGLKGYLATDEGKAYLAPRGVGGSGNSGAGANSGARRPAGAAPGAADKAALDNELFGLVMGLPPAEG